jgi:hypothetical protein
MQSKILDIINEIGIRQKEEGITGSNRNQFYLVITSSLVTSIVSCTIIEDKFGNFSP